MNDLQCGPSGLRCDKVENTCRAVDAYAVSEDLSNVGADDDFSKSVNKYENRELFDLTIKNCYDCIMKSFRYQWDSTT